MSSPSHLQNVFLSDTFVWYQQRHNICMYHLNLSRTESLNWASRPLCYHQNFGKQPSPVRLSTSQRVRSFLVKVFIYIPHSITSSLTKRVTPRRRRRRRCQCHAANRLLLPLSLRVQGMGRPSSCESATTRIRKCIVGFVKIVTALASKNEYKWVPPFAKPIGLF